MINIAKGRYWDEGIKLVSGCTGVSPGCDHCWSLAMENRFAKRDYIGIPLPSENKITTHPDRLKRFNTRRPAVFAIWNDLFHEDVPWGFIGLVWLEMERSPQNTFLILTKRPEKMALLAKYDSLFPILSNVYLGLTVCNQQEWDKHKDIFLSAPGKKFISHEPALEQIDYGENLKEIGVLISGGETGAGARPSHPDIFRSDRDQCAAAGVPFFFKGFGEWWGDRKLITRTKQSVIMGDTVMHRVGRKNTGRELDGRTHDDLPWVAGAQ